MEIKIKTLIDKLLLKTSKKETKWERVGKSDQFILSLNTGKVSVDKLISARGRLIFNFAVLNSSGDIILNLKVGEPENASELADYNSLKNFHAEIVKCFFKVDETIESLLGETEKEGEIGKTIDDDLPF